MPANALCSIGVFYDGSYVSKAQRHYYHEEGQGWLDIRQLHRYLEGKARSLETTYERHHVVYSGWYQGISSSRDVSEKQLRSDRDTQRELIEAGVQPANLRMHFNEEKGVDVALAIDAFDVSTRSGLDLVVLVSGDGDFVPLLWALRRLGIRVLVFGFEYNNKHFGNARMAAELRAAASYSVSFEEIGNEAWSTGELFRNGGASKDGRCADPSAGADG